MEMEANQKLGQLQWMIEGPELWISLNPGEVPPPHRLWPLGASLHLGGDWCTLMGASASAVPRLRAWGTTSPWKLEEP